MKRFTTAVAAGALAAGILVGAASTIVARDGANDALERHLEQMGSMTEMMSGAGMESMMDRSMMDGSMMDGSMMEMMSGTDGCPMAGMMDGAGEMTDGGGEMMDGSGAMGSDSDQHRAHHPESDR